MNYENTLVILIIESDSKFYLDFKLKQNSKNGNRILKRELGGQNKVKSVMELKDEL